MPQFSNCNFFHGSLQLNSSKVQSLSEVQNEHLMGNKTITKFENNRDLITKNMFHYPEIIFEKCKFQDNKILELNNGLKTTSTINTTP